MNLKQQIFPLNLRKFRIQKGIKVENIAKSIGISCGEYSKIENGQRKNFSKHLPKIMRELGITQELLTSKPFVDLEKEINTSRCPEELVILKYKETIRMNEQLIMQLQTEICLLQSQLDFYKAKRQVC